MDYLGKLSNGGVRGLPDNVNNFARLEVRMRMRPRPYHNLNIFKSRRGLSTSDCSGVTDGVRTSDVLGSSRTKDIFRGTLELIGLLEDRVEYPLHT